MSRTTKNAKKAWKAADVERRKQPARLGWRVRHAWSNSPLLLVNLLHLRRAAAGRGWRAYREDLGGFAIGWAAVVLRVIATALYLGS